MSKKALFIFSWLFVGSVFLAAEVQKKSLFHIKRNKNRNQVHYAISYNSAECTPAKKEPVYGYWLDLEIGPNVVNPIGTFESMAYGIKSQSYTNGTLDLRLKALPEQLIQVKFNKLADSCKVDAFTSISGNEGVLKEIYVFAEEGMITPTVKYVDIIGTRAGSSIKQRILK